MTSEKREQLEVIRAEYTKVVNLFIDLFWENTPKKIDLLKGVLNLVKESTWFSQRMIQNSAREAIDMISAAKAQAEEAEEEPIKPAHFGNRMILSKSIALFELPKNTKEFDNWLHLQSIGNQIIFDIPIRRHKHFNQLMEEGKLCTTVQILRNHVQFSFEIETGPKLPFDSCIGIDTGIKSLAALSTGEHLGTELESKIQRIKRCKNGSKGQKRARVDLKSYISLTAKEVVKHGSLIVFENLKGISKNTKKSKRLHKSMRSVIGNWNQAYWMQRLKFACERNRVSYASVSPFNTSITCPVCNLIDKRNRKSQGIFLCQSCGYTANADVNAARNILNRFLTGPYGAGCQAKVPVEQLYVLL
jgi:transposase